MTQKIEYGRAEVAHDVSRKSRKEWLDLRREGLGATDIVAVLGFSSFKGAGEVWADKVRGYEEKDRYSWTIDRGRALEPALLDFYRQKMDCQVADADVILKHPDYDWMRCTLDGWDIRRSAIVETKSCVSIHDKVLKKWAQDGEIEPSSIAEYYFIQVQVQIDITGVPRGFLVVTTGSGRPKIIEVERDTETIETIRREAGAFHDRYIKTGETPPAETFEPSIAQFVWKVDDDETHEVDAGHEMFDLVREYKTDVQPEYKLLAARKKEIRSRITELMDGRKKCVTPTGEIKITQGKRRLHLTYNED